MHFPRIYTVAFLAMAALALPAPAQPPQTGGSTVIDKWIKLEDCRLIDDEYMDGDSFHVRYDREDYIIRLYYVDAPETDTALADRIAEQAEYWGIEPDEIPRLGEKARRFTEQQLRRDFTVYTKWANAAGQSRQPRYFGVVLIGHKNLADLLVEEGLARVYGASVTMPDGRNATTIYDQLRALETRAKQQKKGAWGTR